MSQKSREYYNNAFIPVSEKINDTEFIVFLNGEKSVDSIRLNPYNKRDGGIV